MKNSHLLEEEIQAIVFEQKDFSGLNEHVQYCNRCKNSIEAYKLMFKDLKDFPQPMFDFHVQAPVKMYSQKIIRNHFHFPIFLTALLGFLGLSFGVISYLSNNKSVKLESTWLSTWLVICTGGILLTVLVIDVVISYEKKIKALNRIFMQH